jgi:hypothetical protein
MFDAEVMGAGLAEIVSAELARAEASLRAAFDEATAVLRSEIASLRAQLDELAADPPAAPDEAALVSACVEALEGRGLTTAGIARMVDLAVAERAPVAPEADAEVIDALVAARVALAVEALPPARDGRDVDMGLVEQRLVELVEAAIAALPKAQDGADGVGLAGAVIDRDGQLVVTLTNGQAVPLGKVVGEDGKSAFGDIDFEGELKDDGRTLVFRMIQGEIAQSWEVEAPWPLDQGVWSAEKAYRRGDGVSWGGEFYIAQVAAPKDKPGVGGDWRRAAMRGRDAKIDPAAATPRDPRIRS